MIATANASITYCDFYNNNGGNFTGFPLQGLGEIVAANANGDPCDTYYNIFEDPIFYSTTGDSAYYLTEDSPCIDAGDPTSPLDPDSTIADIGAFYYHHSLWVDPRLELSHPFEFVLHPAYPNPFNPETHLTFALPKPGDVSLMIYDIQGREVARLVDGFRTAGTHEAIFDGSGLSSGIYFARLQAEGFSQTRKMLMVK